ncbi:MAG: hypothetical protein EOO51_03060 [Flavobacterium sp.]|nr:MAG: hypothetical protein EOO51_03060 [Flavobacterium sp.]
MKFRVFGFLTLIFVLASCNDDSDKRIAENQRYQKKREAVFSSISKAWTFNSQPINAPSQQLTTTWEQWRVFLNELSEKPQSTIGAFRKKANSLSQRIQEVQATVPIPYNKPEIKSRLAVLATKVHSLNLFIGLPEIPEQKVVALISEINSELYSVQLQMAEIVRKSEIPREVGESDMIRMLDTSRAIPNKPKSVQVE